MRRILSVSALALSAILSTAANPGSAQTLLSDIVYTPLIVPPGEIRASVLIEGNCASASMKVEAPGVHTNPAIELNFNMSCSAAMWCRNALPDATIYELGVRIPSVDREGISASEVVSELRDFVQSAIDSPDPMDTGRAIVATEAGQMLSQLKQTIKKAYGIMGNNADAARAKLGPEGAHIVDAVLLFEAAALQLEDLGQEIRRTVLVNEFYDITVDETGRLMPAVPVPNLAPTFVPRPQVGQPPPGAPSTVVPRR